MCASGIESVEMCASGIEGVEMCASGIEGVEMCASRENWVTCVAVWVGRGIWKEYKCEWGRRDRVSVWEREFESVGVSLQHLYNSSFGHIM